MPPLPFPVAVWRPDPEGQPLRYAVYAEVPDANVSGRRPGQAPPVARLVSPMALVLSDVVTYAPFFATGGAPAAPVGPATGLPFVTLTVPAGKGSASIAGATRIDASLELDLSSASWTDELPTPVLGTSQIVHVAGGSGQYVIGSGVKLRFEFDAPEPAPVADAALPPEA